MKFAVFAAAAGFSLVSWAPAAEKSGHAEVSLLAGVASYQAGQPVPVGIRLKIEPGWHSYWINPGLGGMPLSADWKLPEGWKAGELRQPVPKRFMTGELPGFGYENEALYLVDLTPPAGAKGEAELKVELSWMTCNDEMCVPGDATISLKLPAGDGTPSADAPTLAQAAKKIPNAVSGSTAEVSEADGKVTLAFAVPGDFDFSESQAFPATPQVIDPGAAIEIKKTEEGWSASAPKNEYADGPAAAYDLVLSGGKLPHPVVVQWRTE